MDKLTAQAIIGDIRTAASRAETCSASDDTSQIVARAVSDALCAVADTFEQRIVNTINNRTFGG